MLNFVLPLLKNPLTRMIGSKVIDGINHKMEKDITNNQGLWNGCHQSFSANSQTCRFASRSAEDLGLVMIYNFKVEQENSPNDLIKNVGKGANSYDI